MSDEREGRQEAQDHRVLGLLDKIRDDVASVKTNVAVVNTDLKHHRREFGELKKEFDELRAGLRALQDEQKVGTGKKAVVGAIVAGIGAAGGFIASLLHK